MLVDATERGMALAKLRTGAISEMINRCGSADIR